MRYLHARRRPSAATCRADHAPRRDPGAGDRAMVAMTEGSGRAINRRPCVRQSAVATAADPTLGKRIVPIVADEARTFGMQSLFRQVASIALRPAVRTRGQRRAALLQGGAGRADPRGRHHEAGAMSSWIAAATSYSVHGTPMLPFYIFYSMFGFQRVGDLIWQAGDCAIARGFLIGATAGRTTLSGEGLQHQDGSSQLIASTVPNCVAWDPALATNLATIIEDGTRRMLDAQEDIFYYITVMNENYAQPAMPADAPTASSRACTCCSGNRRRRRRRAAARQRPDPARSHRGGGTAAAGFRHRRKRLERHQLGANCAATAWPAPATTGSIRKRRRRSHVEAAAGGHAGPVIAASDHVSAVPDLIRPGCHGGMSRSAPTATGAAIRAPRCVDSSRSTATASWSPHCPRWPTMATSTGRV
jgi:pyruvate dehydrogenase E1 component